MLFFKKTNEFDSWWQVYMHCSIQAKKQNISLNELVSKMPDDLFNHFKNIITYSAYTEINIFGDIEQRPKFFAEGICDVFEKEERKRWQNRRLKNKNDAILSYGSENGAVISVEKGLIDDEGIKSIHIGNCSSGCRTQGYYIYLKNNEYSFLLGCVDTYKKDDGFMDYASVNTNKSSQAYVKKYLKDTLGISQITKPENEKEILKDILIHGQENKNFINFYLAEFLIKECLTYQKQKVN